MTRLIPYVMTVLCFLSMQPVVSAQLDYFGQNKVQYRDFKWEVLTTPHFEIFYYQGEEETAYDAARMAERSYTRLSRILRHRFSNKIPVILYASHTDFQQTNVLGGFISEGTGGVTEFNKNRLLLPFTGSYAELEHVLTHELVHEFQGDILYGTGPGASVINPLAFIAPLWFMEGMAEYLSLGRIDEYTHMWLRDAALQGYLPPSIPAMDYSFGVYRFGQALFAYIGEKYGDAKVGEILRKTGRLRNIEEAFRSTIGKDLQQLSEEWTEHVRKTYLPQIKDYDKPQSFSRQLTDIRKARASFHLAPAISPRGDKMVYISNRSLYNDIYLASAIDGRVISKLLEGERSADFESLRFYTTSISWSPDERFISFPAKIGARDALYIMDVRKRKVVRRIKVGLDGALSPSFSPDGKKLIFVGLQGGQSDLYVVDVNGKNLTALTKDRYADRDPVWSPDGTKIAFSTDRGEVTNFRTLTFSHQHIALYDVATGDIEVLPGQYGKGISPQWSGDSKKIAFISDRTGISNIFIIDLETEETYQITNILTGVTNVTAAGPAISWATKGNRLIFTALSWGGFDIFAINDPIRLMDKPYVHGPVSPAQLQLSPPLSTAPVVDSFSDSISMILTPQVDSTQTTVIVQEDEDTQDMGATPDTTSLPGLSVLDLGPAAPIADAPFRGIGPAGELPDTTVWDDGTFTKKTYSPKFSLDFIGGNAGYATNVGLVGSSILSFSDILNNHNILIGANIFGSITDADLLFRYTNLTSRTNWGLAAFQYRFDQLATFLSPVLTQTQTQINRGLQFFIRRPFSRFNRFELGIQGVNRSRELVDIEFTFFGVRRTRLGTLGSVNFIQPNIGLVTDNVLYGITGPIAGARGRIDLVPTFGELQFTRLAVDYRKYYNVLQQYAFAFRFSGLFSNGRDQELFPFGGPYDFRGADFWSVWGSKQALFNAEFRFPMVQILALGWPLPLAFQQIRGSLFFDVGSSWDQETSAEQAAQYSGYPNVGTLVGDQLVRGNGFGPSSIEEIAGGPVAVAYGLGIRARAGFLVLKFDIAHQIDTGERPSWYNNEGLPNIPAGIESEFPGTRSYRLREALNDTKFFFTIGADF